MAAGFDHAALSEAPSSSSRAIPPGRSQWISDYLAKVGCPRVSPTEVGLRELHLAHVQAIPFDMLDYFLAIEPPFHLERIVEKIVYGKRGGGCTQVNELFAACLEDIGFSVWRALARLPADEQGLRPATHKIILVEFDSGLWLVDVGYGAQGPLYPIRIDSGVIASQGLSTFRTVDIGFGEFALERLSRSKWIRLYTFHTSPIASIDFLPTHFYNCFSTRSLFTQHLICARPRLDGSDLLLDSRLTIRRGTEVRRLVLSSIEQLSSVLLEHFDIDISPGEFSFLPEGVRFADTPVCPKHHESCLSGRS